MLPGFWLVLITCSLVCCAWLCGAAFEGEIADSVAVRTILHWQYSSICRGGSSLLELLHLKYPGECEQLLLLSVEVLWEGVLVWRQHCVGMRNLLATANRTLPKRIG